MFAKLTPAHKERIVRGLKANGHVVGFMGDGINDAPALRTADIGISVDTAVDIAKEAADIILLEKSLMVLEEGVIGGRKTFANILKYLKMTASSNFGNVFSASVASAFIPFLPMLPMHLLVQNLLYDISQIAIPFDHVDEELLKKPQRWQPGDIGRFMVFFGPISSIFDLLTYAMMWFIFSANTVEEQTLFQSGWVHHGPTDPDADCAHDPHAEDSVHPESGVHAALGDVRPHHGHRHLPADGATGPLL